MESNLQSLISRIRPLDAEAQSKAQTHQAALTKPCGSLGRLETLSVQLAGITGKTLPEMKNKAIFTMAGDHGVVAEGVSAYPKEVTPQMVQNFLNGGAAINVLSRQVGARVVVVDMGIAKDLQPHAGLINRKVGYGTANIAVGPAMSRSQAIESLLSGVAIVEDELKKGLDIVGTGDMGIGNTTPSAAITAVLTGKSAAEIAGRGTGIDDAGLTRKIAIIDRAIAVNHPDSKDGVDILAKVGGFEIGGIAGVILGAAANHIPVMVDGFISTAGAMIAAAIAPQTRNYMIASHRSRERGHGIMLEWLGLDPLFALDMRLGEGTGAALGIFLAEAACRTLSEMATFGEAGVSNKE